ncbi:Lar family restriction alleviation protein [Citrobacter freundii]
MPCPFCGGKAHQLTIEQDDDPHFGGDVITCTECGASSHVEFGFKENLKSAWNSRTATLQAGNSPVTPDGWIPVSERMPDKLIPVIVMYADGEMWSAMWSGQFWDDGCTIPDPHAITHWREMPAAPQQENI